MPGARGTTGSTARASCTRGSTPHPSPRRDRSAPGPERGTRCERRRSWRTGCRGARAPCGKSPARRGQWQGSSRISSEPTVELVAAAAGGGGGAAALEKAAAAGVLEVADGRVRFSHPLLASVVYAQTPPARRRELHARLAEIVDDPDEQALHLALAASGPDAQVAATVEDAARRARARGAPQAAAELWDRARMLTPPDDADAWRRTIEAGDCHLEAGDTDRARLVLEDVVARLPPGRERALALTRLAWVSGFGHGFRVSADLFRDALAE